MTLRSRLTLLLIGIVATALVVSGVVTYTSIRAFLLSRLDPQLETASFSVSRALLVNDHLVAVPPGGTVTGTPSEPFSRRFFPNSSFNHRASSELFPTGTVGELVEADGSLVGKPVSFVYGGKVPPLPVLPAHLPPSSFSHPAIFNAASHGGSVSYRVLTRPVGFQQLTVVVAIPLTEVNQTIGRLLLVELLVGAAALVGLGVVAWWTVRRGLRPLEDMATTAGAIAEGDLARRVDETDPRTEVGRLGLALNAMLGDIEEAFAARGASEGRLRRFLADASHELRTPLTSIRGYAEIFELGAQQRPDDLATAMRHIREEADRMNVLVEDLLLLARLDQERPFDVGPVDLAAVASRSVETARVHSPGHPISLAASGPILLEGDAARLRQVVDNLVGNALRHSPPAAPVDVVVDGRDDEVWLEVADRGPGVSPEEAEKIFEPFFRTDTSRNRATGGAGLGLAIVAAIVEGHGGSVGVGERPGGGARFWVHLPRGPARPPDPSAEPAPELEELMLPTGNGQEQESTVTVRPG
ncbi:MAG TPA: HAMP domain-containing sensor histidine kinase [Acidimicrobiales bacterium]|nr:HAMP domain-containing sensor histidine kinase [Acidimicrobiales bacterium]